MSPIHVTHGLEEGSQLQTYQASHLGLLCLIPEAPGMCEPQNNNCRLKPRGTHAQLPGGQLPGESSEAWTAQSRDACATSRKTTSRGKLRDVNGTELKGGGEQDDSWTADFPSNLTRQETARRICMKIASQRNPDGERNAIVHMKMRWGRGKRVWSEIVANV